MKGRGHFYEGRGMQVMTTAVRTFKLLGCEFLLATNAAGSLRRSVAPGSLVAITDHINFMPESPLVGANDEALRAALLQPGERLRSRSARPAGGGGRKRGHPAGGRGIRRLHRAEFRNAGGDPHDADPGLRRGGDVDRAGSPDGAPLRPQGAGGVRDDQLRRRAVGYAALHEQTLSCAALAADDFMRLIRELFKTL